MSYNTIVDIGKNQMTNVTVTVRMSSDERDRLEQIAKHSRRSKSFLTREAVVRLIEDEERDIRGIEQAMAEMNEGKGIPHEEAMLQIHSTILRISASNA